MEALHKPAAPTPFGHSSGREDVMRRTIEGRNSYDFLVQMIHNHVVDWIRGDEARAHATLHIMSKTYDGTKGFQTVGIFHDQLRRTKDGWRFNRRSFSPMYHDANIPVGTLLEPGLQIKSAPTWKPKA